MSEPVVSNNKFAEITLQKSDMPFFLVNGQKYVVGHHLATAQGDDIVVTNLVTEKESIVQIPFTNYLNGEDEGAHFEDAAAVVSWFETYAYPCTAAKVIEIID